MGLLQEPWPGLSAGVVAGPRAHGVWVRQQLSEGQRGGAGAAHQVMALHGLRALLHLWRHDGLPGCGSGSGSPPGPGETRLPDIPHSKSQATPLECPQFEPR